MGSLHCHTLATWRGSLEHQARGLHPRESPTSLCPARPGPEVVDRLSCVEAATGCVCPALWAQHFLGRRARLAFALPEQRGLGTPLTSLPLSCRWGKAAWPCGLLGMFPAPHLIP